MDLLFLIYGYWYLMFIVSIAGFGCPVPVMQCLKLMFVVALYFKMCYSGNDTLCAEIKTCTCTTSGSLRVDINCHGKGLNVNTICGICNKVRHVQSLDVGGNALGKIPKACFENCTELEELNLDTNNLSDITKDAFKGLENLKRLNLNNNSLINEGKIHDPELFKPLKLLEELRIQKNWKHDKTQNITYLSNVASDTLCDLKRLYLDGVPNGRFGTNFVNFRNLSMVTFYGSTLFNLTSDTFKNVPHIKTLDLSYCNLTNVEANTFEPLKELKVLNLSYNMALGFPTLRNVSYGLRDSQSIEVLDYSKVYKTFGLTTQLNRCDVWYLQNTTLKKLFINSNRMASIELNALHLFPLSLEAVFLEDNRLTFGPYALQIGCVTNLKRLELSRQDFTHPISTFNNEMEITENKLDSSGGCPVERKSLKRGCRLGKHKPIKLGDFTLPATLRMVGFSSSNLRYEPSVVSLPLPLRNSVEYFDLSYNLIYKWSDPLVIFSDLKVLNLSHNFCYNITGDFFKNCPNLETFDASYNKIGPVLENDIHGSIFRTVTSLRILNISASWIEKLPEKAFIHLKSLEHLDLSYNMLEKLEFQFQHMKNLSSLRLRQNKISTLPLNLLEHMMDFAERSGKNISIDLSDNIIDAEDCNNLDFLSWIIQHPQSFSNIDSYTFFKTGHVQISFQELKDTFSQIQKGCQTYTGIIILATLFIMAMVSVIIGGIIYRYRWRLRYFYYMIKARYGGYVPVQNSDTDKIYEYDVFISYSTDDYQFVTGQMYNELKEAGLSLCLHQKDFLPGHDIAGNIVQAVRNSKITLVVLSPAFLQSKWCIYEFNMARMESIYSRDGENVIYVVMYKPVDVALVSPEMRECFESESYSPYPQVEEERSYFWRMLIRALRGQNISPIN